ncbi:MAG: protein-ADP-ribose hydrolase, partial [Pyramidobacter sp.]|nr:protein-ADP-ribose hydrolase [Pyramidobacter sp.]
MDQSERRRFLIDSLLAERPADFAGLSVPEDEDSQRRLLRALMNVRPPAPIDEGFLAVQDEYLQAELRQ